jgi:hypothetical protein
MAAARDATAIVSKRKNLEFKRSLVDAGHGILRKKMRAGDCLMPPERGVLKRRRPQQRASR